MNVVPPRLALGFALAALVVCAVVAPVQWAQGNTAGAVVLGFFAVVSLLGGVSVLRGQRRRPAVEAPAESAREEVTLPAPTSAPAPGAPGQDPRWHVETLADHLPDPADRRTAIRWFIVAGVVFLAGTVACGIGAAVTGDLSLIGFAVLLAVPAMAMLYAVMRNRADL